MLPSLFGFAPADAAANNTLSLHDALPISIELVSPVDEHREEKSYAIPAQDGTQIDKDNGTIITRWQGKVCVFSLACPHQNTRSEEHTSELQSRFDLVCRLLLEKKKRPPST